MKIKKTGVSPVFFIFVHLKMLKFLLRRRLSVIWQKKLLPVFL